MREIVLATRNPGKLAEMGEIAAEYGIRLLPLPDAVALPPETGTTYLENARTKARAGFAATGRPVLADDSGIEVDFLSGSPGVYSARFSGEGATDASNNALLLARLGDTRRRSGRYRAVLVLTSSEGEWTAQDVWEGEILKESRGQGGFGYDPLFFVPELGLTAAELSRIEKSRHSHRGKALRRLLSLLAESGA
ncbi:MAG: RdgB/HAM1 family non-canonical purine NTP pyrophosphatase [Thermaerobacter sp.]|nr:RdgB/HAM1 family non-canonical purine NTP pyrophosphatase [Thermaerobacter sp.]